MKVQFVFDGLDSSESVKEYLLEKLERNEALFEDATQIDAVFRQQKHARGVKEDYDISVVVHFPKKVIKVGKKAPDLYVAIDECSNALLRRVKGFKDRRRFWERFRWKRNS